MNKSIIKLAMVTSMSFGSANAVDAYCSEPTKFGNASLVDQVNAQLDWLLCLHNEQVRSLNRHADQINTIADKLSKLDAQMRLIWGRTDGIVMRERDDAMKFQAVKDRVKELEARVGALEDER